MLGDNIKRYRKERGFTQEELAIRLHVVRQTVSKWEKNLSVPDAAQLQNLAQELDVSVPELLGADTETSAGRNEIAEQLSRINEQMAVRNRRSKRIWTIVAIILALAILLPLLGAVLGTADYNRFLAEGITLSDNSPYTERDVNAMFEAVREHFKRNYKGCELTLLNYQETETPALGESVAIEVRFDSGEHPKAEGIAPNHSYQAVATLLQTDSGWTVQDVALSG